jgi:hypothetical protein
LWVDGLVDRGALDDRRLDVALGRVELVVRQHAGTDEMDGGLVQGPASVRRMLATGVVGVSPLLGLDVVRTKVLTPSCVRLAGADGQAAPEENPGWGEHKLDAAVHYAGAGVNYADAGNEDIGAPTDTWIAPPKTFASTS